MPRVIQVIEHRDVRGSGTKQDPFRSVMQYLDFDGNILAEQRPERAEGPQRDEPLAQTLGRLGCF